MQLDLSPEQLTDLATRYAALLTASGHELGERPAVLPNKEFFPDRFDGDVDSARRLVRRMQAHAGISDIPVSIEIVEPELEEASPKASSCGPGGCAVPVKTAEVPRIIDQGERWLLHVPRAELAHPVVLTSNVARCLGLVFLVETLEPGQNLPDPVEVSVEVAAVALGFGALLLEAAHIYGKSCSGPSIARLTALDLEELAVLVALFVALGAHDARRVTKELSTTQRDAFTRAREWVSAQRELVNALGAHPERIVSGDVRPNSPSSSRRFLWWGGKKPDADNEPTAEELAGMVASAKKRAQGAKRTDDDELKSLVDEALRVRSGS